MRRDNFLRIRISLYESERQMNCMPIERSSRPLINMGSFLRINEAGIFGYFVSKYFNNRNSAVKSICKRMDGPASAFGSIQASVVLDGRSPSW